MAITPTASTHAARPAINAPHHPNLLTFGAKTKVNPLNHQTARTTTVPPMPSRTPVIACAVAYALAGAAALALNSPAKGWAVLAVSVAGAIGVCILAAKTGRTTWLTALGVIVPISLFQVIPDWFLAKELGTIIFEDNGGIRIDDAIPLAMATMWVLPLLVVTLLARDNLALGAAISALLFLSTEIGAPAAGLWEPAGGAREIAGVAAYVIPAEALLGAATVYAVRVAGNKPIATRLLAGASVSIFYTGALAVSWLLIG